MADSLALRGLLDRASKVFTLANSLSQDFKHQANSTPHDRTAWEQHAPKFNQFREMLAALGNDIEHPTYRCAAVAKQLREANKLANQIQLSLGREGNFTAYTHFFVELYLVSRDGFKEIDFANRAEVRRNESGIDSTPTFSEPPIELIESAERDIPTILADVTPSEDSIVKLVAAELARRLHEVGHTLAAAHWAIDKSIDAGRLQTKPRKWQAPTSVRHVGGTLRYWGKPDDRRAIFTGGGTSTFDIPVGEPTPYENFVVVATDALWKWWGSLTASSATGVQTELVHDDTVRNTEPTSTAFAQTGFLGGEELAKSLGVHPSQFKAFFRQLDRSRSDGTLCDDAWTEIQNPRPNKPKYLYRVDAPELQGLAEKYKKPKST